MAQGAGPKATTRPTLHPVALLPDIEILCAGQKRDSPSFVHFQKKRHGAMMKDARNVLSTVDRVNRGAIAWLEGVGAIALLTMMVITCVDVVGAKMFLYPVPGSIDIVMLAQVVAVSFATASGLILGRHITVEFFFVMLPNWAQAVVEVIVSLLGLLLFSFIVWRLGIYGHYMHTGGEVSATARIPLYPFAYGIAFALIPVCLVFFVQLVNAALRMKEE
jgi:TRAP-type C4-dicarboxylate transport system permease small subunit